MHERHERIEMKTHKGSVMVSTAWPMLLGMGVMSGAMLLVLPTDFALKVSAVLAALLLVTYVACVRMYLGTYLFLPATSFKGARIIARLGRNEMEIHGVTSGEIIVKEGPLERLFKTAHIRVKGTMFYLRGVTEPEKIRAWVDANFPKELKKPEPPRKKGKKK